MSSVLALASGLSKLDVDSLRDILEARKVPAASTIDYIKLAEALLHSSNLDARIRSLRIDVIVALINGDISGIPNHLAAEFVYDDQIFLEARKVAAELPEVGSRIQDAKKVSEFPTQDGLKTPVTDIAAGGIPVSVVTAKRVLRKLSEKPIQLTAKGLIGETKLKSLADSLHTTTAIIKQQIQLLSQAGLLASNEMIGVTRAYPDFAANSARKQWLTLLNTWFSMSPEELNGKTGIGSARFIEYLKEAYPYSDALKRFTAWISLASALGIKEEDAFAVWDIKDSAAEIAELVEKGIPEQIHKGYLSAHLSLYFPGILDNETENSLRNFAVLETEDIASTWQISAQSIARGISSGLNPDEITAILTDISNDPLPATFKVALSDAMLLAERIHIRKTDTGSELDVKSEQIAKELLANRGLSLIALERISSTTLRTIFDPEIVQTALIDAGVFFVGKVQQPEEYFFIEAKTGDPYLAAARYLVDNAEKISHESGTEITLATAARIGQKLLLKVRLSENEVMQIMAAPRSVSGQRVRVIDLESQVEKTLPIKAIEAIEFIG